MFFCAMHLLFSQGIIQHASTHTCHRWGTFFFTNVWIRVVNKRKITIRIYWQAKEGCGGVLDPLRGKGENLRGSQEHSGLDQKARGLARFFVWWRHRPSSLYTRKWERLALLMWKWDVIRILQSKIANLVYQYWKNSLIEEWHINKSISNQSRRERSTTIL